MKFENLLIVGPPRSGTTAIQGAICASLGSDFMPESNYLTDIFELYGRVAGYPDPLRFDYYFGADGAERLYGQLIRQAMGGLAERKEGKVRVFKDPMMSTQFPRARQLIDDATRVLAIVRHPADVLASLKRVRLKSPGSWDMEADLTLAYRCFDGIRQMAEDHKSGELVVRFEDVVASDEVVLRSISELIGAPFDLSRSATPDWLLKTGAFRSDGYGRAIAPEMAGMGHKTLATDELERVQDALAGMLQHWGYDRRS